MRIFLSYSSLYRELAERIAVALRADGHTLFFDRQTLHASDSFHTKIRDEIRRSHLMVFLISPESVTEDSYARTELRIAEREWKSPAGRIVPVMAASTPMENVPAFLREINIIDVSGNVVSEVSYAVDYLSRVRRNCFLRWGLAAVVLTSALGLGTLLAMNGKETADSVTKTQKLDEPQPSKPSLPSVANDTRRADAGSAAERNVTPTPSRAPDPQLPSENNETVLSPPEVPSVVEPPVPVPVPDPYPPPETSVIDKLLGKWQNIGGLYYWVISAEQDAKCYIKIFSTENDKLAGTGEGTVENGLLKYSITWIPDTSNPVVLESGRKIHPLIPLPEWGNLEIQSNSLVVPINATNHVGQRWHLLREN